MRGVADFIHTGSRAVAYTLGAGVIALALTVMATDVAAPELIAHAEKVVGPAFLILIVTLVLVAVFSWVRILTQGGPDQGHRPWLEAGLQAANGVATLALTYTLLGISLGIGGLADQALTPDTVQVVIQDLTARFSLAFMTTVIGLPTAAVLRTLLMVTHARLVTRPHPLYVVDSPRPAPNRGDPT